MRREPEASSSRRRLCPWAPYGLKVSADRVQDRRPRPRQGRWERRELEGRRGWDQKFVRPLWRSSARGPPALLFPDSPSGRFPGDEGEHRRLSSLPPSGQPSHRRRANPHSGHGQAVPRSLRRSAESEPRGARASQGGRLPDHLGRALFARHPSREPPVRAATVPIALEGKGLFLATLHLCDLRRFRF